jgi:hypothetical protein
MRIDGKQKNRKFFRKVKKFDAKNIAILFERLITKVIIVANEHKILIIIFKSYKAINFLTNNSNPLDKVL